MRTPMNGYEWILARQCSNKMVERSLSIKQMIYRKQKMRMTVVKQIQQLCGTLPHSATHPSKTYSMAVRAIPLSVCHQGPLSGYRTGFKKCSDTQQFIQLTVVDDINAKSGWSLKTEKIHLLWNAYIDTTHTLRHLFLTWTSLYLFTFLKT